MNWVSIGAVVVVVVVATALGGRYLAAQRVSSPAPEPHAQSSPLARSGASAPVQTVVPAGHSVHTYQAAPLPNLTQSDGGIWLASLGLGGDEPEEELNDLSNKVTAGLKQPAKTLLVNQAGSLSEFFAPHDPQIVPTTHLIVWSASEGSLAWWGESPGRLQDLLQRISRITAPQVVFIAKDAGPNARLIARLLRDLGVSVRRIPGDGTVLVEVHRPEGIILSALTGEPYLSPDDVADPYLHNVAGEKAEAEAQRNRPRLQRLVEQERIFLAQQLARSGSATPANPVIRATRLRRLLLPLAQGDNREAWQALYRELLHREFPFALISSLSGEVSFRSWPGHSSTVSAYPSLLSGHQAATELGSAKGSYAFAVMKPKELFAWALQRGAEVALNVYDDLGKPQYVIMSATILRSLSEGQMPDGGPGQ